MEDFLAHKEAILKPISDSDPCGEDPKYEDEYSEIKEEVAKMSALGSGSPDWDKVEVNSLKLLKENAKELNLFAYLGYVWAQKYKLAGMAAGMDIAAEALLKFWDDMHPSVKKVRIRARAVDWYHARLLEQLDGCKSEDRELLQQGIDAVKALKNAVYEKFEDPPVNFRKIRTTFEEWLAQAPEPQPEAPPEPEKPAEPEPAVAAPAAAPAPVAAPAAAAPVAAPAAAAGPAIQAPQVSGDASLDDVAKALVQMAGALRTADPAHPLGYQLRRMGTWARVKAPKVNNNREMLIPGPQPNVLKQIELACSKNNWTALQAQVEGFFNSAPLWLDLQYYAAQAAENQNQDDILAVIKGETKAFVARFEDLLDIKFKGGMPLASPQTKDWLEQISREGGGGGGEPDPAAELRSELRGHGAGAFADALKAGQAAIDAAADPRGKMRMRVEVAGFCLEADQPAWADALLRGLVEELEYYRVAQFEPKLAGKAWRFMLEAARKLKAFEPEYAEMETRAMRQLAALDLSHIGDFPVELKRKGPGGFGGGFGKGPAAPKPAAAPAAAPADAKPAG